MLSGPFMVVSVLGLFQLKYNPNVQTTNWQLGLVGSVNKNLVRIFLIFLLGASKRRAAPSLGLQ